MLGEDRRDPRAQLGRELHRSDERLAADARLDPVHSRVVTHGSDDLLDRALDLRLACGAHIEPQ